ncbi:ArsC/Spx/MgsR family protein [Alteraurantiacibacter buctensis]|uniref:Arsenate reductase n=1 Tax=Alteraurantiacibacter buctensis TaxID=1503981 RepID=A0A844Z5Y1_9SPHN|nr:arsenate reductase (glutaredoxin) [Alteraurantiacibacter buctensis]
MKATIWHNPKCGTSRKALARLEEAGCQVEVIEYLKHPPTRETLMRLYQAAGITPARGLRLQNTDAAERGLHNADDDTVLDAMMAEPVLIQRPLVETPKGVVLARPVELLETIL